MTLSSALDITEKVRPPRTVFVNYPLGHTAGKPNDPTDQTNILRKALSLLETGEPGQITRIDVTWTDPEWNTHLPKYQKAIQQ
ncbi:hypothetical protein [Effusibacillus consociatus]|uniref:hypothetical protein n=1 Tax=Effusibacillus consociatus TaxID=1117041 RepID=UPI0036D2A37F